MVVLMVKSWLHSPCFDVQNYTRKDNGKLKPKCVTNYNNKIWLLSHFGYHWNLECCDGEIFFFFGCQILIIMLRW